MRFSQFFIPTTKEAPRDAILKSHQYLARAGYIHQIGSGIYNFLPLGKRVLDKITTIIREEMNSAGALEVGIGFVTPAELWQQSGRYEKYGKELLRFHDRREGEFVLAPTCEESITDIAKNFIKSYKKLPLNLYQINLKFRDELRPRFGLMRGREFLMKDSYSFHADSEDLDREFEKMRQTYSRIFERLGVDFRIVDADSGAIGGSGSKEFMILAECGEDTIVMCQSCEYAANQEAARRKKREVESLKAELVKHATPKVSSVAELSEFFGVEACHILKAVVKKVVFLPEAQKKDALAVFFLRGDDELEETKAHNALCASGAQILELVDASVEDIRAAGLVEGFIGAWGLVGNPKICGVFCDEDLKGASGLICGANEKDARFVGLNLDKLEARSFFNACLPESGRNRQEDNAKNAEFVGLGVIEKGAHFVGLSLGELEVKFEHLDFADLAAIREGDICPCCGGTLTHKKGIEVGHIFKLGDRYSRAMGARFLDSNGKETPFIMGCYGIGVSRLLPAILEQKSDEFGCVWSKSCAPFGASIILSNVKDEKQSSFAGELYEKLKREGVEVLFDDRDERFGFKMKDFELIGVHLAIIIGKSLEEGRVEIVLREGMQKHEIPADLAEICAFVRERL